MGDQAIVVINNEKPDPDIFPCEYAQYAQYGYNNMPNNEDIEQIINQEFITILNHWLEDSSIYFQSIELKNASNQNQISGYVIILFFLHRDI